MATFEPPAWLLITLMTIALGVAVWAVAGQLPRDPGRIALVTENVAFDQETIEVARHQEAIIELRNEDGVPHSFVIDEMDPPIDVLVEREDIGQVRFVPEEAGNFAFYCKLHPQVMVGTLTVRD